METKVSIKDVVRRPNVVKFDHFKDGKFVYHAYDPNKTMENNRIIHRFTIPIYVVQDATMPCAENAMMFMRFIRKAMEAGEFESIDVKAGEAYNK